MSPLELRDQDEPEALTFATQDQIDANRRKVIGALKRSKNQCIADTFNGERVCAIGAAARALLGIRNERQYNLYEANGRDVWKDVADRLGLDDLSFLWHLNDRERLPFPEIAERLERRWFGAAK